MSEHSTIEWTDATLNPVRGCTKISPGCAHCYFIDRLRAIFPGVAENPYRLRNSRNVPLYLLCFAAANTKGAPIAVKIAKDLLK